MNENITPVVDATSVAVILATLTQWLPPIAAFLSIVWAVIRIAETEVFAWAWQGIFGVRPPWNKKDKSNG